MADRLSQRSQQAERVLGGTEANEPFESAPSALPLLTRAIMEVPLPGAPPYVHQLGAEIGLAFVDGALRQNHVRRISESLQLIDHGAALQTVRVDLSLSLLNEGQYEAGKKYSKLRGLKHSRDGRPDSTENLIWVPVTRLPRRSIAPLEVLDAHGDKVARLTSDETGQLMAPAMYRLLRSILDSDPDATNENSDLYALLNREHRARWVIQRALVALATERANPEPPPDEPADPEPQDAADVTEEPEEPAAGDTPPRRLAVKVLQQKAHMLDEFFRLLHIIVNHYFLVVALDEAEDEHALTYHSPLEAVPDESHGVLDRVRSRIDFMLKVGNAYDVEYHSRLSTGVRSYHFAAETETDLSISPPYIVTDFDKRRAGGLAQDLCFLAEELEGLRAAQTERAYREIVELELGTVLGQLSEIVRRRAWEAEQVGVQVREGVAPACRELRQLVIDTDGAPGAPYTSNPQLTPELLTTAADELEDFELGADLSAERDPPSSHAHAYWRKPLEGHGSSLTTIDVRCNFRITDSADGGPRYVGFFVGGVAFLNLLIAAVLFARLSPWWSWHEPLDPESEVSNNADALVAVLLLVPGFLYTRLRMPVPGTIAGRLRTVTRWLAYAVILSSAFIGVLVAAGASPSTVEVSMWVSIGIDLFCFALLWRDRLQRPPAPRPAWTRQDEGRRQRRARMIDARFFGVGSSDRPREKVT